NAAFQFGTIMHITIRGGAFPMRSETSFRYSVRSANADVSDLVIWRSVGWILSGRFGKAPRASRPPPAAQSSAATPEVTLKRPAQVLQRPCRQEPRAGPCDALVDETHTKDD